MLSTDEIKKINTIKIRDEEAYKIIIKLINENQHIMDDASHEIKNWLSNMNSIYQFISSSSTVLHDDDLWPLLGKSIDTLIEFMNRTTIYRKIRYDSSDYSDINHILTELPDLIDERIDNDCEYDYNIVTTNTVVNCSQKNLKLAFTELGINAVEGCMGDGEILISSELDNDSLIITISNKGTIENPSYVQELFYSEKNDHFGLGFSIAQKAVNLCGGALSIDCVNGEVKTIVKLPVYSK